MASVFLVILAEVSEVVLGALPDQVWGLITLLAPLLSKSETIAKVSALVVRDWKQLDACSIPANKGGNHITIDTYLVYPVGTELDSVEAALSGAFFTQDELKSLNRDDPYQRQGFAMDDTLQSFTGGGGSHSFDDTTKPPQISFDEANDPQHLRPILTYEEKSFAGSIASVIEKPARILGGHLGYWMRIIQLNLHQLVSVPRQYLATCHTTEEFLLGRCGGEDVAPKYIKDTTPVLAEMGEYCGSANDWITNYSSNYIIKRGNTPLDDATQDGYFVDSRSPLKLDARSFVVDGATLVTTNTIVAMNPGQASANRCGGSGSQVFLTYLPDGAYSSTQLNDRGFWETNASVLEYVAPEIKDTAVNLAFSLNVKPGYYKFFLNNAGCFMGTIVQVKADGTSFDDSDKTHYFRLNSNQSLGQARICSQIVMNSNMPGAEGLADNVRGCPINPPYQLDLNLACGGLHGDNQTVPKVPVDWDEKLALPGLATYQQLFNRPFVLPTEEYRCQDLFPNVIAEVDCNQSFTRNPIGCNVIRRQCPVNDPNKPLDPDEPKCTQSDTNFCAVEYLQEKIEAYAASNNQTLSPEEANKRAKNASMICQKESRGNSGLLNDGCVRRASLDYSVGLFQINMLAHDCSDTFLDYGTATDPFCTLDSSPDATQRRAACVTQLQDPDYNAQKMLELSGGGVNWNPWLNAKRQCGIN